MEGGGVCAGPFSVCRLVSLSSADPGHKSDVRYFHVNVEMIRKSEDGRRNNSESSKKADMIFDSLSS